MVRHLLGGMASMALVTLTACGPGLRDGNYLGDARFVLQGTLESIDASSQQPVTSLRIGVLWQMVAMPHPVSGSGGGDAADAPTASDGGASPVNTGAGSSNPNGTSPPPAAPQPSNQPTNSGQNGDAVQVAFPAPVSLALYDFPETEPDWPARQAEGTVVVFYDRNGDGSYDASSETVAATLTDYRLVYVRTPEESSLYFVNSLLDNSAAFPGPLSLAQRRCEAAVEHLTVVPNQAISLTSGQPTACGQ